MSKYRELADRLERLVIMDEVGSNNSLAREAAAALRELEAERDRLRELLNCRAGRLLENGTPFFVVKASEPYAPQVVELIKRHERANWSESDDAWAKAALEGEGDE